MGIKGQIPWNKGLVGVQVGANKGKKFPYKPRPSMKGRKAWNKGISAHWIIGNKNPRWVSDRTKLVKSNRRGNSMYREWRMSIYRRDNFKCRMANPDCCGRIEAHHILGWTKYPELRYEINNGITLCHYHHPRKKADEIKLSPYFQNLVAKM